jgi:hypothetical protein
LIGPHRDELARRNVPTRHPSRILLLGDRSNDDVAIGVLALICVLKGKYRTALFGLFLPPVGVIGALRLARPSSIWARHRYRGKRLERATRRAAGIDRRWAPLQTDWEDFVGGKPSQPNPPANDDVHR